MGSVHGFKGTAADMPEYRCEGIWKREDEAQEGTHFSFSLSFRG